MIRFKMRRFFQSVDISLISVLVIKDVIFDVLWDGQKDIGRFLLVATLSVKTRKSSPESNELNEQHERFE